MPTKSDGKADSKACSKAGKSMCKKRKLAVKNIAAKNKKISVKNLNVKKLGAKTKKTRHLNSFANAPDAKSVNISIFNKLIRSKRLPELPPKPKLTTRQVLADKLTKFCGSWKFILIFICFLLAWVILNTLIVVFRWDPFPFTLLNLILSSLAALQAPIILISQNRSAERDRITVLRDYAINRKTERENRALLALLKKVYHLLEKRKWEKRISNTTISTAVDKTNLSPEEISKFHDVFSSARYTLKPQTAQGIKDAERVFKSVTSIIKK